MATFPSALAPKTVHLIGPGQLKVENGVLKWKPLEGPSQKLASQSLKLLMCYGNITITDQAMRQLLSSGVEVAWLSKSGRICRGRTVPADGGTQLRMLQHAALSGPWRLNLAKQIVAQKIRSQQAAFRHYQKHRSLTGSTASILNESLLKAQKCVSLESLRGIEGSASKAWFHAMTQLVRPPFRFTGRNRRPPRDPVNALLSLGYTLLHTRVTAALQAHGLEANLGALHSYLPGRASLACDLCEPFRTPIVDRWVLRLTAMGKVAPQDFHEVRVNHSNVDSEEQPSSANQDCAMGVSLHHHRLSEILVDWERVWARAEKDLSVILTGLETEIRLEGQLILSSQER